MSVNYYSPVLGKCVLGVQAGPQVIVVRQLVGEQQAQKALDIHICVPRQKPAVEQVIDVMVKKMRISEVQVMTNKVVVCGDFELKAIYAACLPDQPVHAAEVKRVRFAFDVPVWGTRCGMDAEARIMVEYVDYDCPHHRGKWQGWSQYNQYPGGAGTGAGFSPPCAPCTPPDEPGCFRDFDVSVVLKAMVKVMTDREIVIYPGHYPGLPVGPKG